MVRRSRKSAEQEGTEAVNTATVEREDAIEQTNFDIQDLVSNITVVEPPSRERRSSGGRKKGPNPFLPFVAQSWDSRDPSLDGQENPNGGVKVNYGSWLGFPPVPADRAKLIRSKLTSAAHDLGVGVSIDLTDNDDGTATVKFAAKTRVSKPRRHAEHAEQEYAAA